MNRIAVPRVIAIIAALACVAGMFLPFVSTTGDYRSYILSGALDDEAEGYGLSASQLADLSLVNYGRLFIGEGRHERDSAGYIFSGALMFAVGVFALITLFFALGKKAVPTLIFDLLMGFSFWMVNKDIELRRVMDSSREWGIAHWIYYPLAVIIAACAVWLFVLKRRQKREMKARTDG